MLGRDSGPRDSWTRSSTRSAELLHLVADVGEQRRPVDGVRATPGGVRLRQQVEIGAQRGERGAQLVTGIGDELSFAFACGGQRRQHRVEAARKPSDLVVTARLRWA